MREYLKFCHRAAKLCVGLYKCKGQWARQSPFTVPDIVTLDIHRMSDSVRFSEHKQKIGPHYTFCTKQWG